MPEQETMEMDFTEFLKEVVPYSFWSDKEYIEWARQRIVTEGKKEYKAVVKNVTYVFSAESVKKFLGFKEEPKAEMPSEPDPNAKPKAKAPKKDSAKVTEKVEAKVDEYIVKEDFEEFMGDTEGPETSD